MSGNIRILVLEDDEDMRDALREVLSEEGYEVCAVGRGSEAVALAARETFDLMVSDIRMEGISGLDAIEQIREQQPELGSLVVSGWASEEDTLRAVRLNVGGYLKKPFSMSSFLASVKDLIRKREQQKERDGRTDSLSEVLDWALHSLARVTDAGTAAQAQSGRNLVKSGQCASALAQLLGYSAQLQAQVRWLTFTEGLREVPEVELPEWLLEDGTLSAETQAGELGGGFDPLRLLVRDESLIQLARLALEAHSSEPPQALEALEGKLQSSLSTELRNAYQQYLERRVSLNPSAHLAPEVQAGLKNPAQIHRSLIALAKTLEQSGDFKNALEAYSEVYRNAQRLQEPSNEVLQALQGAAVLAFHSQDFSRQEELLKNCLQWGRQLGPLAQASSQLTACIINAQKLRRTTPGPEQEHFRSELLQSLEALSNTQQRLQLRFGQAASYLLMHQLGDPRGRQWLPAAISVILKPSHSGDLADHRLWLIPQILEVARELPADLRKAIYEICLEYWKEVRRYVGRGEASAALLDDFGGFLLESKRSVAPELLELFQKLRPALISATLVGREEAPVIRIYGFGFFEVFLGQEKVPEHLWKTQKSKALLALLCSRPGKAVHEDQILEAFWPEDARRGKRNLYATLSHLRRSLRGDLPETDSNDPIIRDREYLSFNWNLRYWFDLQLFESALAKAEQCDQLGQVDEAITSYRRVCQLSRGPFLEGWYYEWAVSRRDELDEQLLRSLNRLTFLLCQGRAYQEALEHGSRAVALAPHHQESHLLKMRCLLGLGKPEEVVRHFQNFERYLKNEYGFEPNTELVELFVRAKHGMPDKAQ